MLNVKLQSLVRGSLYASVALLPLAIGFAQVPASAQTAAAKTQAQLDKEAADAKAAAAAASGDAAAADDAAAAAAAGGANGKDIVVTGTSIRGSAPTGTNLITLGADTIVGSGAAGGSQLLATVPQIAGNFFNGIPQTGSINQLAAGGSPQTTNKPTLRPVPTTGGSNDTGNSTLILVDGNRQSGIGVNGLSANPDAVPPALLERVELNTDGGSSIYGSDATGGVINYVTRKKFDGFQVGGRYGFAPQYKTYDGNVILGKDWGSGSAYISYSYAHNDPLFNRDREWYQSIDWSTRLQTGLNCDLPNVRVNGVTPLRYYAVSATGVPATASFTVAAPATGTANLCTLGKDSTLASANTRHNILFSFTQALTDDISLTIRPRYSKNSQAGVVAPQTYTGTVASIIPPVAATQTAPAVPAFPVSNPYFKTLAGTDSTQTTYSVLGDFRPAFGDQKVYSNSSVQYGGVAELTWNIDKNWQFRGLANYDRSRSAFSNPTYNPTAIANGFNGNATTPCSAAGLAYNATPNATTLAAAQAACFNPFNIAASNPALLAGLLNWQDIGKGRDQILNFKGTVDGSLIELPGGKVKIAFGAEYLRDKFSKGQSQALPGTAITFATVTQTNKSLFAELNIPVVSSANASPLLRELRLSLSGRYDKYSGISGVFNPRFAASYKPVPWLALSGNWGRTFRAPTAPDLVGTTKANTTISAFQAIVFNSFLVDPTHPIPTAQNATAQAIVLRGTQPGIQPQKGINWSVAAEVTPLTGLRARVGYYSIDYIGQLGDPASGNPIFPTLANLVTLCQPFGGCSEAQISALSSLSNNPTAIAAVDRSLIYGLYDLRKTNLGITKTGGIDYLVSYTRNTGFGAIWAKVSGSIILENRTAITKGSPFVSSISLSTTNISQVGGSLHRATAEVGAKWGGLRASVVLNHNDGYPVNPSPTVFQSHVKAFNVYNGFVSYDFPGKDFLQSGLQLSLTVTNIFNSAPPLFMQTGGNGTANGSTLGRIIMFGIQKKFF